MRTIPTEQGARTRALAFGTFRLEPDGSLYRDGALVRLTPTEQRVMELVAAARGSLVPKEDLLDIAWEGANVGEASLTRCMHTLRRRLGDARAIHTEYGRGYRLALPVVEIPPFAPLRTGDVPAGVTDTAAPKETPELAARALAAARIAFERACAHAGIGPSVRRRLEDAAFAQALGLRFTTALAYLERPVA